MNQQSQSGKKYDLPLNVEKEIINYAKNNDIKKVVLFGSRARCSGLERGIISGTGGDCPKTRA